MTVPSQPLDDFALKTLMDFSKDRVFLNDKELMLKTLREECENASTGKSEQLARLVSVEKDLQTRLDILL